MLENMADCISVGSAVCTPVRCQWVDTHADKEGSGRKSVHGICGRSDTLKKASSLHGKGTEDGSVNLSSASVKKLQWDIVAVEMDTTSNRTCKMATLLF